MYFPIDIILGKINIEALMTVICKDEFDVEIIEHICVNYSCRNQSVVDYFTNHLRHGICKLMPIHIKQRVNSKFA